MERPTGFVMILIQAAIVHSLVSSVLANNDVTSDPVHIVDYLKNGDNFAYDGYRDAAQGGVRNEYALMLVTRHGHGVQRLPETDYSRRPLIGVGDDGDPRMRIMRTGDQLVIKAQPKKKGRLYCKKSIMFSFAPRFCRLAVSVTAQCKISLL